MVKMVQKLFASHEGREAYRLVLSAIHDNRMAELIDGGVLIGLSGGSDSVFLACFLAEYRRRLGKDIKLLAVHINHMIRGEEADRDEVFSAGVAKELGIEFVSRKIDVPSIADKEHIGLEEAARNARYSAFEEIISGRNDVSCVATAHNSTDNVETIIFNLLRGCGTNGASGIAPKRDNIIRPLIHLPKDKILHLLEDFHIEYVTDSTNYSTDYTRNYIRHEILPRLSKINPSYHDAFTAFSVAARYDSEYILDSAEDVLSSSRADKLSREYLLSLHPALLPRALSSFALHNGVKLSRSAIDSISGLLTKSSFEVSLHGNVCFVCERGVCYFRESAKLDENKDFYQVLQDGENRIDGYCAAVHVLNNTEISSIIYNKSIKVSLSSAIIEGALYVRFRRDGDSYRYGGMTRKLKKVFNDRGIAPSIRDRIPVICDDNGIVWVPGLGVREDCRDNSGDQRCLVFSLLPDEPGKELYVVSKEA